METQSRPAQRRRDPLAERAPYARPRPRYVVERQVVYLSADEQDYVVIFVVLDRDELQVLPEAFLSREKAEELAGGRNSIDAMARGVRADEG